MALELAELAAGLPVAASLAMAGGISVLREGRRRHALNEAVHELRRPLQAIALSAPESPDRARAFDSSLRMAAAAVDQLDSEINGRAEQRGFDPVSLREVVAVAVERWGARASLDNRVVNLEWGAGDPHLLIDAVALAQALDNMISNGLEHGRGEIAVEVSRHDRVVRLVVSNRWRGDPAASLLGARDLCARISGRRRHGHGLRIVRRVAARSGGSFQFRRRGDRCEAVLCLPLPGGGR
ncbi:MAG TPA: ATP-binding protein [Solirubrobacterales bacterium]